MAPGTNSYGSEKPNPPPTALAIASRSTAWWMAWRRFRLSWKGGLSELKKYWRLLPLNGDFRVLRVGDLLGRRDILALDVLREVRSAGAHLVELGGRLDDDAIGDASRYGSGLPSAPICQ